MAGSYEDTGAIRLPYTLVPCDGMFRDFSLSLSGIEEGLYWPVFCISFKDTDLDALDLIGDYQAWNYLDNDDIRKIAERDDHTRLRLYHQVQLNPKDTQLVFRITGETTSVTSFQLHYIEFGLGKPQVSEGIKGKYSPNRFFSSGANPDQIISVADNSRRCHMANPICSKEVSASGSHAATLYFSDGLGHLDLWDLTTSGREHPPEYPTIYNIPCAKTTFSVPRVFTDSMKLHNGNVHLAISSLGSQLVLHPSEDATAVIPFLVFDYDPRDDSQKHLTIPRKLRRRSMACKELQEYVGIGCFHKANPDDLSDVDERYIIINRSTLNVYSTADQWTLLQRITLVQRSRPLNTKELCSGLGRHYFACAGTNGVVLVWSCKTGEVVSVVYIPEYSGQVYVSLSQDSSMIAVVIMQSIYLYRTFSGVLLGMYRDRENRSDIEFVSFGQEHFFHQSESNILLVGPNAFADCLKVVRVSDMSVIGSNSYWPWYSYVHPTADMEPLLTWTEGSIMYIKRLRAAHYLSERISSQLGDISELRDIRVHCFSQFTNFTCNTKMGLLRLSAVVQRYSNRHLSGLEIKKDKDDFRRKPRSLLLLGPWDDLAYTGFYIRATSQLVIATRGYLQVWNLYPAGSKKVVELAFIWKLNKDDPDHKDESCQQIIVAARVSSDGRKVVMHVANALLDNKVDWVTGRNPTDSVIGTSCKPQAILTVPKTNDDTFPTSEEYRRVHGVIGLIDMFVDICPDLQDDIIRYLMTSIRPSSMHPTSCLVILCQAWSYKNNVGLSKIISRILPNNSITWIPPDYATKDDDNRENPLAIMLKNVKSEPTATAIIKIIVDYCVTHAKESENLAFLTPIFSSLPELVELFPNGAIECLHRIAYIPVKQRSFIINNHLIAHPPQIRLQFWKAATIPLNKAKNPVMQLDLASKKSYQIEGVFAQQIFMASFDALWLQHKHQPRSNEHEQEFSLTWWKALFYMVYAPDQKQLIGVFFAIIVLAVIFLWLEIRQALVGWSSYNIDQLIVIYKNDTSGHARLLSFSLLIVFLHALFELRVNKAVCKYVTTIQMAVFKMRVFFFIFAAGMVVFTMALIHLVHACPVVECKSDPSPDKNEFPRNFFKALSSIYFFMGGRYDPISYKLDSDDWAVHIMMVVFFFFTVILMLNVLVALVNMAFNEVDDSWRVVWIKSRVRFIESAENMSYHIPGFRQSYNYFPNQIYFSATKQKLKEYRERYRKKNWDNLAGWSEWDEDEDTAGRYYIKDGHGDANIIMHKDPLREGNNSASDCNLDHEDASSSYKSEDDDNS
ncbi:hypothetical protein BGZ89_001931 [Linnemannia elongata]|nr:hypothetical protein BGZ89_001931 [Linnemannia elongata]